MSRPVLRWFKSRSRLALTVGVLGAAALSVSTIASLGGFTASITNTGDKAQSGSLLMQEAVTPAGGGSTTTCLSTAASTAITGNANAGCTANKFGALTNGAPGSTSDSVIVIANQGSLTANSFSIGVGACAATPTAQAGETNVGSDTAGFCGKVDVTIEDDTVAGTPACVYPAQAGACPALSNPYNLTTLSTFAATPVGLTAPVAAGAARTYKVTVGIDVSATNADQAMAAGEPITFTFGS
jgi:hypothetical protein